MSYKIGILIPSTTNKRDWKKIEDTSLYNVFLKSFLITYSNEYNYTLYLTIDPDDKLYSIDSEIEKYALSYSSKESELLYNLNRETHINVLQPRMLSGHLQGRFLSLISKL